MPSVSQRMWSMPRGRERECACGKVVRESTISIDLIPGIWQISMNVGGRYYCWYDHIMTSRCSQDVEYVYKGRESRKVAKVVKNFNPFPFTDRSCLGRKIPLLLLLHVGKDSVSFLGTRSRSSAYSTSGCERGSPRVRPRPLPAPPSPPDSERSRRGRGGNRGPPASSVWWTEQWMQPVPSSAAGDSWTTIDTTVMYL